MMHRNQDAFPSLDTFDPTRWMDPDRVVVRAREKRLVPFSRGSHTCIGQNLTLCKLYVTLGTLFRRFNNLAVFNIRPENITYMDYFTAFHPKGSRAFKIVAKKAK
jgi:cytochrome P450